MAFDPEFLASLERLAHLAKRLGRVAARRRRTPRRASGSGGFRDRRPYAAGDEVRAIDWPAYARLGRLLLKLFETEEPRDVLLLVDVSASMGRPPRKLDWSLRAAAAAAWLAIAHHDRVGAYAFADRIVAEMPPRSGRGGAGRALAFLEDLRPAGASAPRGALAQAAIRHRSRAVALLFSDGLWPGDIGATLAPLRAGGLDATLVHAIDDEDRSPIVSGAVEISSVEGGACLNVAADEPFRASYRAAFDAHAAAIAHACARTGVFYLPGQTGEPIERILLEILRAGGIGG